MKNHRYRDSRGGSRKEREQGSALIVVLIVIVMCMLLAVVVASISHSRSEAAMQGRSRMEALAGAETALTIKLDEFNNSDPRDTTTRDFILPNGVRARVITEDLGTNVDGSGDPIDDDGDGNPNVGNEVGIVRMTATATTNAGPDGIAGTADDRGQVRAVEIHLATEIHPLFFKAIFQGDKYGLDETLNLGPGGGSPNGGQVRDMTGGNFKDKSTKSQNADYIEGDVHVNGNLHVTGRTLITGDVDVTGGYTGNSAQGTTTASADRIESPALNAMDYRAMSRQPGSWFIESCSNFFDKTLDGGLGAWDYSHSGKHSKHGPTPTQAGYPQETSDAGPDGIVGNADDTNYNGKYDGGGSFPGGDTSIWDGSASGLDADDVDEHVPSFLSYGPFSDSSNNGDGNNNEYNKDNTNDLNSNPYFWQDNVTKFTNGNFHMGYGRDGNDRDGTDTIDFSSVAGPDAIYGTADDITFFYIRGNLWLDTRGKLEFNFPTPPAGQVLPPITVVIEGNMYVGDGLEYTKDTDAIMFIVKQSDFQGENFIDDDRNGLFKFDDDNGNGLLDADERFYEPYILAGPDNVFGNADDIIVQPGNAAGDRTPADKGVAPYRGPTEGQGNVYFGDLKAEQGGITSGYIFAENNVYMVANNPDVYGIDGFLNAGGIIDMGNRQGGNNYIEYRVRYDDRIETGAVTFKGLPSNQTAGGEDKLSQVTWREVTPN